MCVNSTTIYIYPIYIYINSLHDHPIFENLNTAHFLDRGKCKQLRGKSWLTSSEKNELLAFCRQCYVHTRKKILLTRWVPSTAPQPFFSQKILVFEHNDHSKSSGFEETQDEALVLFVAFCGAVLVDMCRRRRCRQGK